MCIAERHTAFGGAVLIRYLPGADRVRIPRPTPSIAIVSSRRGAGHSPAARPVVPHFSRVPSTPGIGGFLFPPIRNAAPLSLTPSRPAPRSPLPLRSRSWPPPPSAAAPGRTTAPVTRTTRRRMPHSWRPPTAQAPHRNHHPCTEAAKRWLAGAGGGVSQQMQIPCSLRVGKRGHIFPHNKTARSEVPLNPGPGHERVVPVVAWVREGMQRFDDLRRRQQEALASLRTATVAPSPPPPPPPDPRRRAARRHRPVPLLACPAIPHHPPPHRRDSIPRRLSATKPKDGNDRARLVQEVG